ncbi:MAG: VOC family protein [Bacteroidota bacterium]
MMYPGFNTTKLAETKMFYTEHFGFEVIFEDDWFILLKKGEHELGFMLPNLPQQNTLFQPAFGGGSWLAFQTNDAHQEYERLKQANVPIVAEIKDEVWGDRHFVIKDPNGIGVDVYQRIQVNA